MSKEHKVGLPPSEALEMLDKVSPTFCLAKWLQVTLNLHTGSNSSCCLTPPSRITLDKVKQNLNEFHNTEENLRDRSKLLKGEKASSCQFCWSQEAKADKIHSERVYKSASPWASSHLSEVLAAGSEQTINPTYLEVSFSSKCNLKCAYCSPQTSSSIYHEIKKFGPYSDSSSLNDIREIDKNFEFSENEEKNPYIPMFYEWFEEIIDGLEVLRFTGGEPLLHENVFKALNVLKERPQPNLTIEINSNLSLPKSTIERFIKLIESIPRENYRGIKIISSIDTGFEEAAYIRSGLNTDYFKANVDLLLESIPHIEFRFTVTFSILSVFNFEELIEYSMELKRKYKTYDKILLSIYPLISPYHLSLKILPKEYENHLTKIQKKLSSYKISDQEPFGFNDYEIDSFNKVVAFYEDKYPKSLREKLQRDFCYFIKDFDIRKKSNIIKTFPEIKSFMELCLQLVQDDLQKKLRSSPSTVDDFKQLLMFFQRKTSISDSNREEILIKITECLERVSLSSYYEIIAVTKNIYHYDVKTIIVEKLFEKVFGASSKSLPNSEAIWSLSELLNLLGDKYPEDKKEKVVEDLVDRVLSEKDEFKSNPKIIWSICDFVDKQSTSSMTLKEKVVESLVENVLGDPSISGSCPDIVWSISELIEALSSDFGYTKKADWKEKLFSCFLKDLESDNQTSWAWIKVINQCKYSEEEIWNFIDESSSKLNRIDHLLKIYRWNDSDLWLKRYNGKWERNWVYELMSRENPSLSTEFIKNIDLTSEGYLEILWYFLVAKADRDDLFDLLNQFASSSNSEAVQKFLKKSLPVNPIALKRLKSLKNILK